MPCRGRHRSAAYDKPKHGSETDEQQQLARRLGHYRSHGEVAGEPLPGRVSGQFEVETEVEQSGGVGSDRSDVDDVVSEESNGANVGNQKSLCP